MTHLIATCALAPVPLVAALAGYLGWYLSHRSYIKGFEIGYQNGYQTCQADVKAVMGHPKPNLRPV